MRTFCTKNYSILTPGMCLLLEIDLVCDVCMCVCPFEAINN